MAWRGRLKTYTGTEEDARVMKNITGFAFNFTREVIIELDGPGFHAYCPALKGLHTCGNTKEEALRNVSDACTAYLLSLIKHGDSIPVGIVRDNEKEQP